MMDRIKIEGIATISEKGFHFDSGLPSDEPILNSTLKLHGTLKVRENACVDFVGNGRIYLPPEMHLVCQGEGYRVKRTTRHYIIQLKVPVVEHRADTSQRLADIMPRVLGEITLDRKEVLDV